MNESCRGINSFPFAEKTKEENSSTSPSLSSRLIFFMSGWWTSAADGDLFTFRLYFSRSLGDIEFLCWTNKNTQISRIG